MKRWAKISAAIVAGAAVAVGVGLGYVWLALPNTQDAPLLAIEPTPETIREGEYLVEHVMVCNVCHGERDDSRYGQPTNPERRGAGGSTWTRAIGFPGHLVAPNLTPHHLGDWTDGEIARAITDGVDEAGRPLFPVMPYPYYRAMCQEDLERVIAYLRTLPSVETEPLPTSLDFPLDIIVRTWPQPSQRPPCPRPDDLVARGKYLVEMASCKSCHTRQVRGQPLADEAFAGGQEFTLRGGYGIATSSNITPHVTGIAGWTEETFIQRFRGVPPESQPVTKGEKQTEMPWPAYAGMRDEDLKAIFAYLQTVTPIEKNVTTFVAR